MMKTFPFLILLVLLALGSCKPDYRSNSVLESTKPDIFPDYTDIVIPVNIAPLNFLIQEKGDKYAVEFEGADKGMFSVISGEPKIIIPEKKWKSLITKNIGKTININVFIRNNGQWTRYQTFTYSIVSEKIDPYIVFRRINTGLVFWNNMSIMQRSLEDCEEVEIINNKNSKNGCVHCHTFQNNDSKSFMMHFRAGPSGTYIKTDNKELWLNTGTPHTLSGFVYPAWHPTKNLIAYSTNRINQDFHGFGHRINYVRDLASDIVLYDIDSNKVFTSPDIASWDCENLPNWSPDGKWLYFIKCPRKNKDDHDTLTKYDLMRVSFDPQQEKIGKVETVLSSAETGLSISHPTVSPDGKFVVFCMADYGYFDVNNPTSDLYILELSTMKYKKLPINSDVSESFHSWSSNSRWLIFTSKRIDDIITLPFFSYINENGIASKPFVVPVKDPETLKTRFYNFNRPLFVTSPVKVDQNQLLNKISHSTTNVWFDSLNVDIDAIAGPTITTLKNTENDNPYKNK